MSDQCCSEGAVVGLVDRTLRPKGDWTRCSSVQSYVTYDDVGRAEKLESDRTLVLRPIAFDRTRPVMLGSLLETTGR